MTPPPSNVRLTPFELHRLAAALVEAAGAGDAEQTTAVLATVDSEPSGMDRLLPVLAGLVGYALASPPQPLGDWIGVVRASVDQAEQTARDRD